MLKQCRVCNKKHKFNLKGIISHSKHLLIGKIPNYFKRMTQKLDEKQIQKVNLSDNHICYMINEDICDECWKSCIKVFNVTNVKPIIIIVQERKKYVVYVRLFMVVNVFEELICSLRMVYVHFANCVIQKVSVLQDTCTLCLLLLRFLFQHLSFQQLDQLKKSQIQIKRKRLVSQFSCQYFLQYIVYVLQDLVLQ